MCRPFKRCNPLALIPSSLHKILHSLFSLANLTSLNRFFGNIPLTALRNTSPPPHFPIMRSKLMLFRLPGRVE